MAKFPNRKPLTEAGLVKWLQIQRMKNGEVTWEDEVFFFSIVTFLHLSCQCREY